MNDIDDLLRRTYASPRDARAVPTERLRAAVRSGRRRRARRQAMAGVSAAAVTIGLLAAVVSLRHPGDEGTPADTSRVPVTTSVSTDGSVATGTSIVRPPATGIPQFIAVSTTGRIEVWGRTGLLRTTEACPGGASSRCRVDGAAATRDKVWFVAQEGSAAYIFDPVERSASVVAIAPAGEHWTLAAVADAGRSVVVTTARDNGEPGPAVMLRDGARTEFGTAVTAVAVSGDGRLAYAERNGTFVVRRLSDNAERRIELASFSEPGSYQWPDRATVTEIEWSPNDQRLLTRVERGEDSTWVAFAVANPIALALSDTRAVPACWSGVDTVAIGAWVPSPGDDTKGPIALVSAANGERVGTIAGSFGESLSFACRGDGAIAMVTHASADSTGGGDLVVVNPQGVATRLGVGYELVLPLGSGPVTLLDPTTLPPTTTTVAPVPSSATRDAFAALTADGTLEVWTPAGKKLALAVGADVLTVAIAERSIWYAGVQGTLWRAALDGSTAPVVVVQGAGEITALAASANDATVWFVRNNVLVRRERGVETDIAQDGRSVALSPDQSRLAYTTYAFGGTPSSTPQALGALVVRDLRTGVERRVPWKTVSGAPSSLEDLRWSPDSRRLLVADSWEGSQDFVFDTEVDTNLDAPAYLDRHSLNASACWLDATTVARGLWSLVYAEGPSQPSDIVSGALTTGLQTPYGVSVYGKTLACRSDGSVALVDQGTAYERPGDLVVVRAGGRRTVLGRGYASVFPG